MTARLYFQLVGTAFNAKYLSVPALIKIRIKGLVHLPRAAGEVRYVC